MTKTKKSNQKTSVTQAPDTVAALFASARVRFADREFLHLPASTAALYDAEKTSYSYAAAGQEIDILVAAYLKAGVKPGMRIAVGLENRPEFFFHFLALNEIGAGIVPLNLQMQDNELLYLVRHSESAAVITLPDQCARFQAMEMDNPPQSISPEQLVAGDIQPLPAPAETVPQANDADREAALLYTSGTTGVPKGCILSNDYFLEIGRFYTGQDGICQFDEGQERLITPLPVTHMNALACSFIAVIQTGGCLIQLDRFHPREWWDCVRETRATIMHYLGVMPAMLLNSEPSDSDNFSNQVKFGFGAGCDPRHHQKFEDRFGIPLLEAWAMTETGAGAWIMASGEPRMVGQKCFGQQPETLDVKIVSTDETRVCDVDEPGELLVRRRDANPRQYFFSGYLKDAEATEEAWRDGWFHTGDIVRVDERGYFYFVDRLKNIIRRSGENIAATEVETVLQRHSHIEACVVVPVPDDIRGEEVLALIVPKKDYIGPAETLADMLFNLAMQELAYYKAPAYFAFVEAIPLTASQKVKRQEAKALARESLASGATYDFTDRKKAPSKKPSKAPSKKPLKTPSEMLAAPAISNRPQQDYNGVVVALPVTVPYERYSPKPAHWWIGRALRALRDTASVTAEMIDGFCVSSFSLFPDTAVGLTQHLGLSVRWLDHIPMGGASGVVALRRAARAVQSGDASFVVCVAGDANEVSSFRNLLTSFSRFSQDAGYPYGSGGPNGSFALMTKAYMKKYGAKREDFGKLCVSQRENALQYPHALMKKPLSLDAYMQARVIADPLHLYDCVMPCGGAEAFVVTTEDYAKSMGLPFARIRSTIERHNAFMDDDIQLRGGWVVDRDALWSQAGISPGDVDFIQTYDDYPVISMMQFEDLGFCDKGEAKDYVRAHELTINGDMPHNTSGGQLSVGQAGAAGGYLGLVEAIRQLTFTAGATQIPDCSLGLVSGFGMVNFDRGICSAATILEASQDG